LTATLNFHDGVVFVLEENHHGTTEAFFNKWKIRAKELAAGFKICDLRVE
jgi:hypothetical protein